NVNDPPDAVNDAKTVSEDSSANTVDVLANDTDADNLSAPFNEIGRASCRERGSHGTVAIAGDGQSVTYTPDANYYGADSFTYTICDNDAAYGAFTLQDSTRVLSLTNVNDPPDAVNDAKTVSEDSSANTVDVLANDTDADNLSAPFN